MRIWWELVEVVGVEVVGVGVGWCPWGADARGAVELPGAAWAWLAGCISALCVPVCSCLRL